MHWLLALVLSAGLASAEGERAGEFDYYVLSLSWSPNWCERVGSSRVLSQCEAGSGFGWVLHGLWPQYESGWPSYCPSAERNPSRRDTAAMADIMGSGGSAWHQWNKHGRCSGLSSEDFYALSRLAYESVARPEVFRKLPRTVALNALVVEEAFLAENPNLSADMLTVTCKEGQIQEVRICLDRGLEPRVCGRDVRRDCTLDDAVMFPVGE